MKYAGILAVMMPGAALAHSAGVAHAHPHGAEGLIAGLTLIALAGGVAWMRR